MNQHITNKTQKRSPLEWTTTERDASIGEAEEELQQLYPSAEDGPNGIVANKECTDEGAKKKMNDALACGSSNRRKTPQTLSVAHKQWLMCVAGTTIFFSVLVIVLIQTVAKTKHRSKSHQKGVCETHSFATFAHDVGLGQKADLPSSIAKTHTLQLALNATEQPAAALDGPYTAIMSLCDGSLDVPPQRVAKQCLMKKRRAQPQGTTLLPNDTTTLDEIVSVKYIFAVWSKQGECVDYFDGTMSPGSGFVEVQRNETNRQAVAVEFRVTFTMPHNIMAGTPILGRQRRAESQLHVVVKAAASSATEAEGHSPQAQMMSYANGDYALTVPLVGWDKMMTQRSKGGGDDEDPGKSPENEENNGKNYKMFGHTFSNLFTDFMVPVLILFVLPSLAITAYFLHRRNQQLAAAIERTKKGGDKKKMSESRLSSKKRGATGASTSVRTSSSSRSSTSKTSRESSCETRERERLCIATVKVCAPATSKQ